VQQESFELAKAYFNVIRASDPDDGALNELHRLFLDRFKRLLVGAGISLVGKGGLDEPAHADDLSTAPTPKKSKAAYG